MEAVNRAHGLLIGTSQFCEAAGKQSGNYMSSLQKVTAYRVAKNKTAASISHTLCNGGGSSRSGSVGFCRFNQKI